MNVRVFAERGEVRHLCDGQRHFRSDPRARFECAYEGRCNGTCRNGQIVPLDNLSLKEEEALGITVPIEPRTVLIVDCLMDFEYAVYDDRVRVPRSRAELAHVLKEGESQVIMGFGYSVVGVVRLEYRIDFNIVITNRGGRAFATYEAARDEDDSESEPGEPLFDDEWDSWDWPARRFERNQQLIAEQERRELDPEW